MTDKNYASYVFVSHGVGTAFHKDERWTLFLYSTSTPEARKMIEEDESITTDHNPGEKSFCRNIYHAHKDEVVRVSKDLGVHKSYLR